jgi:hypothetical protein
MALSLARYSNLGYFCDIGMVMHELTDLIFFGYGTNLYSDQVEICVEKQRLRRTLVKGRIAVIACLRNFVVCSSYLKSSALHAGHEYWQADTGNGKIVISKNY